MVYGIVNNVLLFRRDIFQRVERIDAGQMRMMTMTDVQILTFPDRDMFAAGIAGKRIFRNAPFDLPPDRPRPAAKRRAKETLPN